MVTISPFTVLSRVSVWAVKVDDDFFPKFLSLNLTELCMPNEMNQIIK